MDTTTRALLKFLGLEPEHTKRVVLILDPDKLPRMAVTSLVRPALGAEAGLERIGRTRSFDLVPTDDTKDSFRTELEGISLDLGPRDDEEPGRFSNVVTDRPIFRTDSDLEGRLPDGRYAVGSSAFVGREIAKALKRAGVSSIMDRPPEEPR